MYNPFYKKHVQTLIEIFSELNEMADHYAVHNLRPERVLVIAGYEAAQEMLKTADTLPLPKSALKAGRDVSDYAYLMVELLRAGAKPVKDMLPPTVREVKKYEEERAAKTVRLSKQKFLDMLVYRAKASETLKRPAKDYGLDWQKYDLVEDYFKNTQ